MATATLTQKQIKKETTIPTSIIPQKMNLRIRVLHAMDYPEIAQECQAKHTKVLEEFGLAKDIDSSKSKWWENSCSYLFIVEDMDTEVNNITGFREVGASMRLDKVDDSHSIPVESAIPSITSRVHEYNYILGELCGLWVDKKFSERRLATHLFRSVIVFSSKLGIKNLLAMPPKHTKVFFDSLGFQVVDDIGNHGEINYPPKTNYVSTLMQIEDSSNLDTLPQEEKEFILWLRSHPKQFFSEEYKNEKTGITRETNIIYDLRMM
ncbi:hypothetical protein ACE193_14630 [Bernardetia sp. OM2101]|uniref:hypothetical protein n=1 Tax=Bernardetia sp. OM2101 TaxID=3344876 RepID=UPI0035D03924